MWVREGGHEATRGAPPLPLALAPRTEESTVQDHEGFMRSRCLSVAIALFRAAVQGFALGDVSLPPPSLGFQATSSVQGGANDPMRAKETQRGWS